MNADCRRSGFQRRHLAATALAVGLTFTGIASAASARVVSIAAPTISGNPLVGATLSASTGAWSGAALKRFAYQWQQCSASGHSCSSIAGATGATLAVPSSLAGSTVRVDVTATDSIESATARSTPTAVIGMTSQSHPTFDSETAYLDGSLPSLSDAITVSSVSAFEAAIANAKAGQTINVLANVSIPGEFTGFNRVVSGGTVNVVFQPGAGFTGMAGRRLPAVWIRNSGGWRIWGGTITNPDGNGILVYATPGPFVWTGFTVHDTGDTCVAVYPVGGNITGVTLKGVAGTATPNLAFDPHAEKGTGIHAWNIADANGGLVENSTFAADTRDQATGAAVEIDTGHIGGNVKVFARATHLGFAIPGTTWTGDAVQQVAGNVVQLWGASLAGELEIPYVEGNDIQGRILATDGVYSGADLSQATVDYGRATGPILQNPRLSNVAFAPRGGIRLGDVLRAQ